MLGVGVGCAGKQKPTSNDYKAAPVKENLVITHIDRVHHANVPSAPTTHMLTDAMKSIGAEISRAVRVGGSMLRWGELCGRRG